MFNGTPPLPGAAEASQRITVLRAAAERVRDQLPLVPVGAERDAAAERLARLDRRVADLVERARRGADVGGIIGPLEIDLAMLDLFGGLPAGFVAAYDEVWPLADGWRDRLALGQLLPLLVHSVLFGGSYGARAVAAARHYVG